MIVSGGKILGIHKVEHDLTFSGDGVRTPLGLDHVLHQRILDTSAKLDKSAFESWSAQTENWDIEEYTGGDGIKVDDHEISVSAKYLTSGDLEPYATKDWVEDQKYITSAFLKPYAKTQWVQEELYKKQNLSDMSAYAQSAWVDENFQPKGNYITPEDLEPYATSAWVNGELGKKVDTSAMSAYATSAWVDENFLKEADYHEYSEGNDYVRIDDHKIYGYDWTSAVSGVPFKLDASAFEQYSAWANGTYLKDEALKPYATSAGLDENQQYAMTNSGWAPVDIPDDTVISGTSGISVQKIGDTWVVGTSAQYATSAWVNEELAEKQDTSAMSAYATSAWVDGNFQTKGDYITPAELETALKPYATSSQVNGELAKKVDVTAMSAYATSAWVEENFSKLTLTVSYDAQSEELHLDFSPASTDYVLIGDRLYHYVQIGDQLWIDENLDYKFAYDGGTLPIGASGTPSTPAAWYYGNDEATYGVDGNKYGLLYNWHATKYLEDNKSTLLPEGWRVPSTTDWDTLANTVGGASTAGTVLKSTTGWSSGVGTDDYGFSAVPAGGYKGSFYNLGSSAIFWTSIESSSRAYYRRLDAGTSLNSFSYFKTYGCSVRLVKDVT